MLLVSFTGAGQYSAEKGTIYNFFPVYKLIIFRRYTSKNMLSCAFFLSDFVHKKSRIDRFTKNHTGSHRQPKLSFSVATQHSLPKIICFAISLVKP